MDQRASAAPSHSSAIPIPGGAPTYRRVNRFYLADSNGSSRNSSLSASPRNHNGRSNDTYSPEPMVFDMDLSGGSSSSSSSHNHSHNYNALPRTTSSLTHIHAPGRRAPIFGDLVCQRCNQQIDQRLAGRSAHLPPDRLCDRCRAELHQRAPAPNGRLTATQLREPSNTFGGHRPVYYAPVDRTPRENNVPALHHPSFYVGHPSQVSRLHAAYDQQPRLQRSGQGSSAPFRDMVPHPAVLPARQQDPNPPRNPRRDWYND